MTSGNDITRRGALGTVAAGAGLMAAAASGELAGPAHAQTQQKTFVLVHGAWHGGWCWRRVSDLLEKKGHKVFSPTLTGVGDRSHLLSKDINLDTHITDIVNLFKWEDLKDVCLVGAFLRRLARLGRAGTNRRSRLVDRLARCVQAGGRTDRASTMPPSSAARRSRRRSAKGLPGRRSPKAEDFG